MCFQHDIYKFTYMSLCLLQFFPGGKSEDRYAHRPVFGMNVLNISSGLSSRKGAEFDKGFPDGRIDMHMIEDPGLKLNTA